MVSIITVTWNSTQVTGDLLRSIHQQGTYRNIEVIVVDNGSSQDPLPALKAIYPEVKVIYTGKKTLDLPEEIMPESGPHPEITFFFFLSITTLNLHQTSLKDYWMFLIRTPDAGMVSPKFHYFF